MSLCRKTGPAMWESQWPQGGLGQRDTQAASFLSRENTAGQEPAGLGKRTDMGGWAGREEEHIPLGLYLQRRKEQDALGSPFSYPESLNALAGDPSWDGGHQSAPARWRVSNWRGFWTNKFNPLFKRSDIMAGPPWGCLGSRPARHTLGLFLTVGDFHPLGELQNQICPEAGILDLFLPTPNTVSQDVNAGGSFSLLFRGSFT